MSVFDVRILGDLSTIDLSIQKSKVAHLVIAAETEDFDEEVMQQFRDEGFNTVYVPMLNGGDDFVTRVHNTGDTFGTSEYYGIVGL